MPLREFLKQRERERKREREKERKGELLFPHKYRLLSSVRKLKERIKRDIDSRRTLCGSLAILKKYGEKERERMWVRVYRVRKRRKHYTVVYIASPCLLFFEIFAFLVLFSFFSQTIIGPSSLGFVLKFLRDHRYSDEKKKKCVYIYIYVYVYIHIYICIYIEARKIVLRDADKRSSCIKLRYSRIK